MHVNQLVPIRVGRMEGFVKSWRTVRALVAVVTAALFAVPASAVTLSASQEALADSLAHELVAPCCWTSSVSWPNTGGAFR